MIKKAILAVIAGFIVWSILDFLIHSMLLEPTYEATSELWRPVEEIKMTEILKYILKPVPSIFDMIAVEIEIAIAAMIFIFIY